MDNLKIQNIIVQIYTPYSSGTGIYLADYKLIVTNESLIRENKTAVVSGLQIRAQEVEVIYLDKKNNIGFLKGPEIKEIDYTTINKKVTSQNAIVYSSFYDINDLFLWKEGRINFSDQKERNNLFILHDTVLGPIDSGGPLLNSNMELIGMNCINPSNSSQVFAIPISFIIESIDSIKDRISSFASKCIYCDSLLFEDQSNKLNDECVKCGGNHMRVSDLKMYQPSGLSATVEDMIKQLGYNASLSRRGPYNWTIERHNFEVNISYFLKKGLLVGEVHLVSILENNESEVLQFLLQENYKLEGISFSTLEDEIFLSLFIYDQYLNTETMLVLFDKLMSKSYIYYELFNKNFRNVNIRHVI